MAQQVGALLGLSKQRASNAHGIAPRFHVRTGAYPYGNVAAYVVSGRQRRKALTVSAEKTPGISAIDTTNFARQIVLDFEFAPVPKQRQRSITTATLWASSRSLCRQNLPKALRFPSASLRGYRPWTLRWPIRS